MDVWFGRLNYLCTFSPPDFTHADNVPNSCSRRIHPEPVNLLLLHPRPPQSASPPISCVSKPKLVRFTGERGRVRGRVQNRDQIQVSQWLRARLASQRPAVTGTSPEICVNSPSSQRRWHLHPSQIFTFYSGVLYFIFYR